MEDVVLEYIIGTFQTIKNFLRTMNSILTVDIFGDDEFIIQSGYTANPFKQIATTFLDFVIPLATTIMVVFFLVEFLNMCIKMDVLKWEFLLRAMLKVVLAKVGMSLGVFLLSAIVATGNSLIMDATNISDISVHEHNSTNDSIEIKLSMKDITKLSGDLEEEIGDLDTLDQLLLLAVCVIPLSGIRIACIVGTILAWSRAVELTMYYIMFPIPCATLVLEDTRMAKRYFFSFAAVVLQGVFMILVTKICTAMILVNITATSASANDIGGLFFDLLMWLVLMIVGLGKSSSWAQRILDV